MDTLVRPGPAHKQIFQGKGKVQRRKRVSVRHSPAKYELTAAYADGYNTIVNKLLSNPERRGDGALVTLRTTKSRLFVNSATPVAVQESVKKLTSRITFADFWSH